MPVKHTYNPRFKKGFLLPDVMIAVFITAVALVAILTAMLPAFRLESYKRDEIIATGLAQEGIEIIRNIRDNNWKTCVGSNVPSTTCGTGVSFKTAFMSPFPSGIVCPDYDYNSSLGSAPQGCSSPGNVLGTSGFSAYRASGAGRFTRAITISGSGNSRTVKSEVKWGTGANTHTVTLSDTLTAWGDK